jgi:hypothetical protein
MLPAGWMESSETVDETVGFGDVAAVALNLRTGDAAAVEALELAYHAAALARQVVGLAEQYQDLCSPDFGGYAARYPVCFSQKDHPFSFGFRGIIQSRSY